MYIVCKVSRTVSHFMYIFTLILSLLYFPLLSSPTFAVKELGACVELAAVDPTEVLFSSI